MKASELRIGNLLLGNKGAEKITAILENGSVKIEGSTSTFTPGACLEPIPLTEEWLLKFGLPDVIFIKNRGEISIDKDGLSVHSGLGMVDDYGFNIPNSIRPPTSKPLFRFNRSGISMKASELFDDLSISMLKLAGAMNKFGCSVNEAKRNINVLAKRRVIKKEHPFKKFFK